MAVIVPILDKDGNPVNISYGGFGTAGAPSTDVRTSQFISGGVPFDVNLLKLLGNNISVNAGATDAGTIRTIIANNQSKIPVEGVSGGTPIITNLTQIAGNAIDIGAGAAGTATPRVILASNNPEIPVNAKQKMDAAVNSGAILYKNINVGAAANIKTSAAAIYGGWVTNQAANFRYLKLFAKASTPVLGTDVPVATLAIPPQTTLPLPLGFGAYIATGLGIAATTGISDTDTVAASANDVVTSFWYI